MNKISTTALSRKYHLDRDKLIKYFLKINYIDRDENNKMVLTDQGILRGGEYVYTENNSRYIVWHDNMLDEGHDLHEINLFEITKNKESKTLYSNDFKRALNRLVDEKYSIDDISKTLEKPYNFILKMIASLPRIKSKYCIHHGLHEFTNIEAVRNTSMKQGEENIEKIDTSHYKEILRLLITGFNPITGEELPENEIIHNPNVRKALMEIYELLNGVATQEKNKTKKIEEKIVLSEHEAKLYSILREWRNRMAIEIAKPSYVIASNNTLKRISQKKPRTKSEFKTIKGIGKVFFEKYADSVVEIIEKYENSCMEED